MEISTREKTLQIVSRYVIITLSISIMTIGVYFFKFPNNFVFGGVTGGAALVAKLTPLSASAFSSCANILLLILGWIFLGRDFAISTGWATVVMTAELALFEKYVPLSGPLSNQPMLDLVFAIALPAIASALLFNVGASSGGTDVVALILKKYAHMKNTGEALLSPTSSWCWQPASLVPLHRSLLFRGSDGQEPRRRCRAGTDEDVQGHPHHLRRQRPHL